MDLNAREKLEQIEKAISAIELTGQEYRIGSRTLRRADLATLYAQRKSLMAEAAEENDKDGGGFYRTSVAVFEGR